MAVSSYLYCSCHPFQKIGCVLRFLLLLCYWQQMTYVFAKSHKVHCLQDDVQMCENVTFIFKVNDGECHGAMLLWTATLLLAACTVISMETETTTVQPTTDS